MAQTVNEIQQEWKKLRPLLGELTCHIDNKLRELERREAELTTAENFAKSVYENGKEDGAVDGWSTARLCTVPLEEGGVIPRKDLEELFGCIGADVLKRYTMCDAKEKISAYMDKIQVGDEVIAEGSAKYVVTKILGEDDYPMYGGIDKDGNVYSYFKTDRIEKTGKHYDICQLLDGLEGAEEDE